MKLTNRHELVFIYDTSFSNPNGDPTENNELRMIGDTLYVTDVRLKRTIRDYLDSINQDVFVKESVDEKGNVLDGMGRLADKLGVKKAELDKKPLTVEQLSKLQEFIDIRYFGSAIKVKMTGAVQFNFGQSMHDVQQTKVQGTTIFSSGENKGQGTFTEMFMTPYALISFHGIANEVAARTTGMTNNDFELLKEAMRNGTKNLITRSKFEQLPRLLIDVVFKEGEKTHIGELNKYVRFVSSQPQSFIMDISEGVFDFEQFSEKLNSASSKIEKVEIWIDQRVSYTNLSLGNIPLTITTL